jgi:hypothetical protein
MPLGGQGRAHRTHPHRLRRAKPEYVSAPPRPTDRPGEVLQESFSTLILCVKPDRARSCLGEEGFTKTELDQRMKTRPVPPIRAITF